VNHFDPDYLTPHMIAIHLATTVLGDCDFAAIQEWIDHTEACAPTQSPDMWADGGPRKVAEYRLLVDAAKALAETADGIRLARMVAP
jgi:hypothetical protein